MERVGHEITELEFRIVEQMVTDYYDAYFHGFDAMTPCSRKPCARP